MGQVLAFTAHLESLGECYQCGMLHAASANFVRRMKEKGETFYCPAGHAQSFTKSEITQLKEEIAKKDRQIEFERDQRKLVEKDREHAERSRDAYKGKITEMKNRVGNGVCPCCKRTFQNVMAHMKTKHPDFKDTNEP